MDFVQDVARLHRLLCFSLLHFSCWDHRSTARVLQGSFWLVVLGRYISHKAHSFSLGGYCGAQLRRFLEHREYGRTDRGRCNSFTYAVDCTSLRLDQFLWHGCRSCCSWGIVLDGSPPRAPSGLSSALLADRLAISVSQLSKFSLQLPESVLLCAHRSRYEVGGIFLECI